MTVEVRVVDWLNTDTLSPEAFMNVPTPRPKRFVTVERTGGPEGLVVGRPLLAVQVWGEERFAAAADAEQVVKRLRALAGVGWVGRVNIASVHNFPDPDSGQARYQITVELVTKF